MYVSGNYSDVVLGVFTQYIVLLINLETFLNIKVTSLPDQCGFFEERNWNGDKKKHNTWIPISNKNNIKSPLL